MPRLNEGSLVDRVGLELASFLAGPYPYNNIGVSHQNNNAQIINRHQVV